MLITDISKQVGKNGTKINISYLKDRDGIIDKYTLTSVELPRPEMLDIWSAINIAFQRVNPAYNDEETWLEFDFHKCNIKYSEDRQGKTVIKAYKLTGTMLWDYMGFCNIITDWLAPQQNMELTAAVDKLTVEASLYAKGKRAQMQLFDDKTIQDAEVIDCRRGVMKE